MKLAYLLILGFSLKAFPQESSKKALSEDNQVEVSDYDKVLSLLNQGITLKALKEEVAKGSFSLESQNEYGETPLRAIIESAYILEDSVDRIKTVETLIEAGSDINEKDKRGDTLLHAFIQNFHSFTQKDEKKQALDTLNKLITDKNIHEKDGRGDIPLNLAIRYQNLEVIQVLAQKTDLNLQDDKQRTPLHLALSSLHFKEKSEQELKQIIDAILSLKTKENQDMEDRYGFTPLLVAINRGWEDENLLESLVTSYNLHQSPQPGKAPLGMAKVKGNQTALRILEDKHKKIQ